VGSCYAGKCDEIKEHVYNIGLTKSLNLFTKLPKRLESTWPAPSRTGLSFAMPLGFDTIVQPPEPEDLANIILVKHWEFAYKTYHNQVEHQKTTSRQAFAVVLGHCSLAIVD
jgi:hypothetical protein